MKTNTPKCSALCLATFALTVSFAQGETLASWDFSANLAPTTEASDVSASNVTFGAFNGIDSSGNYGRSSANTGSLFSRMETIANDGTTVIGGSAQYALDNDTYFEFSFSPDAGALSITDFSAEIFAQTISSGSAQAEYTVNYFLRSSEDSYGSDLVTASHTAPAIGANDGDVTTPTSFSGSLGSEFSNISSSVTFRVYAWVDTANATPFQTLRMDSVSFNGSVIPEPGQTAAMAGAGALLGILFLRRRAKR